MEKHEHECNAFSVSRRENIHHSPVMPCTGYFAYFAVKLMQQQQQPETGPLVRGMRYEERGGPRPDCQDVWNPFTGHVFLINCVPQATPCPPWARDQMSGRS